MRMVPVVPAPTTMLQVVLEVEVEAATTHSIMVPVVIYQITVVVQVVPVQVVRVVQVVQVVV